MKLTSRVFKSVFSGGASVIKGWNSKSCGTCWQLTYAETGASIIFTAIDSTEDGFNLSEESMNTLTDDNAEFYGTIPVTVEQVDKSQCGL